MRSEKPPRGVSNGRGAAILAALAQGCRLEARTTGQPHALIRRTDLRAGASRVCHRRVGAVWVGVDVGWSGSSVRRSRLPTLPLLPRCRVAMLASLAAGDLGDGRVTPPRLPHHCSAQFAILTPGSGSRHPLSDHSQTAPAETAVVQGLQKRSVLCVRCPGAAAVSHFSLLSGRETEK